MARSDKIPTNMKIYSVLKRVLYTLFGLVLAVLLVFILTIIIPGNESITGWTIIETHGNIEIFRMVDVGWLTSIIVWLLFKAILFTNVICFLSGGIILAIPIINKKKAGKSRDSLKFFKLSLISMVLLFIAYFAVSAAVGLIAK